MRLIAGLEAEHVLIEQVLGALRTYVQQRLHAGADREAGARFVRFFRVFVGGYHHDREELVLFPALVREAGLPSDRGPIASFLAQHHELARQLTTLAALLDGPLASVEERRAVDELSRDYAHGLWRHIDAENSVLYPESTARLARAGVYELPERDMSDDEVAARADGERLVAAYPPVHDATALRGEGCVVCPSFGTTCDGVEREWWNESEWDEFADHLG